ncbi:hypothetical protein G6F65_020394 [Rhizopus arrhizus]|nr:hypothetical protein G6F65_020394 [Rhizopus arrhizus]
MHRAAVYAHPRRQSLGVGVQPGKCRQQRGVDIDQPAGIVVDEARGQDAHETRQNDVVGRVAVDFSGQGGVERFAAGVVLMVQGCRANALCGGPFQAAGIRPAGDDGGDFGRPTLVAARFGQRLHVAAPPRDQDDEAAFRKLCFRQDRRIQICSPQGARQGCLACRKRACPPPLRTPEIPVAQKWLGGLEQTRNPKL